MKIEESLLTSSAQAVLLRLIYQLRLLSRLLGLCKRGKRSAGR